MCAIYFSIASLVEFEQLHFVAFLACGAFFINRVFFGPGWVNKR